MDIKQSLTYFRQEKGWIKTYALLILISLLGGVPVVGLIATLVPAGYFAILQNQRTFKPKSPLPKIDIIECLKVGLIVMIGMLALTLINFVALTLFTNIIRQTPEAAAIAMVLITIVIMVVAVVYDILFLCFTTNLKLNSFFKFKAIKLFLVKYRSQYIELCIKKTAVAIVFVIVFFITAITIIVPLLILPSLTFICADLNAQFLRKVFKIKN